jgi:hypothetical protein
LTYALEQGSVEKTIIQQCIKDNRPLPQKMINAPTLEWGLELFYNAFFDLHTCRPIGMMEMGIRWLDIKQYCILEGFSEEQTEDAFYFIKVMDNAYLSWREKQRG